MKEVKGDEHKDGTWVSLSTWESVRDEGVRVKYDNEGDEETE